MAPCLRWLLSRTQGAAATADTHGSGTGHREAAGGLRRPLCGRSKCPFSPLSVLQVVNSHLTSRAFGSVVSLKAHSFEARSGCEVEVRAMVRDPKELVELKRVGTGVLSIAPTQVTHGGPTVPTVGSPGAR